MTNAQLDRMTPTREQWTRHMADLLSWLTTDGGLPPHLLDGLPHPRFWTEGPQGTLVAKGSPSGRLSTTFNGTWGSPIVANFTRREDGVSSRWKGKIPRVVVEASKRAQGF